MLQATFCLQPAGDTLTRKGLYESVFTGCIPVVFREDKAFLQQLAFSRYIPYKKMWVYIPARLVEAGEAHVTSLLRRVPESRIRSIRRHLRRWARCLSFSARRDGVAGYNNLDAPDAFTSTLREVWHLWQSEE
uniref:Exostosin GT47 domain-containing protein n=1 Tax=Calcidiscus leptoporus TaxID=127549 RepID=A0A7S0J376_9EUKA|mmetsp:Transcript_36485/g.85241  ORF Transcript_36485/g.85241 Transcript_36485/m.85241 type:complete len:133 (+) Transcript_36485:277-675(+)